MERKHSKFTSYLFRTVLLSAFRLLEIGFFQYQFRLQRKI